MSGENSLLAYTREGLNGKRSACYVTKHNDLSAGIPDLSVTVRATGTNTWIELKATAQWPVKAHTRVFWDHFTEEQALFLRRRGGWLFVRVSRNYFLFTGDVAWELWERKGFTRAEMFAQAHRVWAKYVDWQEFAEAIT